MEELSKVPEKMGALGSRLMPLSKSLKMINTIVESSEDPPDSSENRYSNDLANLNRVQILKGAPNQDAIMKKTSDIRKKVQIWDDI